MQVLTFYCLFVCFCVWVWLSCFKCLFLNILSKSRTRSHTKKTLLQNEYELHFGTKINKHWKHWACSLQQYQNSLLPKMSLIFCFVKMSYTGMFLQNLPAYMTHYFALTEMNVFMLWQLHIFLDARFYHLSNDN